MKKISVDPITRLEGHGKIEIFVNDAGEVANVYFQIPELRGFERFCVGRPVEELARITPRICGVCPEAHHMASAKAIDAVFGVEPTPAGRRLRELLYNAFFVTDHTTHFYILAGPDFVIGPTADPAERNILGIVHKVGLETTNALLNLRAEAAELISIIGGKQIHPVCCLPGGVSKAVSAEEQERMKQITAGMVEFAKFTLQLFDDVVLKNNDYVDLIKSDAFTHQTYSMGMVDENNHVNFYDGKIRVTAPDGTEFVKFEGKDYLDNLAEHVEPYSYLVYPYLKKVGWKGFVDGKDSGVYKATPMSRLNAADGMATPLAQAEYERYFSTLGGKPVHATLATHWARLVELMYAAERAHELAGDPDLTDPNVRTIPEGIVGEGIGVVEAPRGTLYHHYKTDDEGMVTNVNLIVGTTNNNAAISMSLKKAAEGLIKGGTEISEGTLNMIEMAFRAYDPCFGCATHTLPGDMPLEVVTKSEATGEVIASARRNM
ncbi:MAG TPA: Ni/Fe hydrogenase subunit alpha [Thermoleophilia bacterium]|nr:Ni/Fe hydrogenase subunit alpha [Thermoleophilia bacterium]HQG04028.1 Ni/Fe hydrogenase subunit alpha [Thermoleophilia bacterium]HQG53973.1 Ni/Fe hydrogenase subunit alpha [Thermoleophilia bacterium]HQJ98463.1 Ni/Fe hydrogenase subunit alpha [Thermoleophilia bacterium]